VKRLIPPFPLPTKRQQSPDQARQNVENLIRHLKENRSATPNQAWSEKSAVEVTMEQHGVNYVSQKVRLQKRIRAKPRRESQSFEEPIDQGKESSESGDSPADSKSQLDYGSEDSKPPKASKQQKAAGKKRGPKKKVIKEDVKEESKPAVPPVKRGRGRPRKYPLPAATQSTPPTALSDSTSSTTTVKTAPSLPKVSSLTT
jgi:hypothetical protein